MKKLSCFLLFALLPALLLLHPFQLQAASDSSQFITISLPQKVISKALQTIMPLTLDGKSSQLEGAITIVKISQLEIRNNQIFGHINLRGDNLSLVTRMAEQDIRLKLGTALADFDCKADLRYDAQKKILFVRPVAEGIDGEDALKKGDIGKALLLFLNGREFPLEMQNIQPIVTEASNKIITIQTDIIDIRAIKGALQLHLIPRVTAKSR